MARGLTRIVAGTGAFALAVLTPVATATAQSSGSTVITNTESVNASLDPSGNVDVVRVYDQIAIQGSGDVSYTNPVSTAGLRNLDGFGGFTVEDDAIVEETSVDGQLRRRTVSDFELDLPVSISVVYTLDGQEISPADLVGKSGEVNASYTITNETCAEEEVTVEVVDDTEDMMAEICDPMAGSLSFTLPSQYTDVVSETGFLTAGDGRGGTTMTLSVQMISGLTDSVVEADYTAQVENATIPAANLSILPVVVDYVAGAQKEALAGGADSGRELAENGELLDENVLALAEGSAELVNGLILLDEGAAQLSDGLVNTAAPGSNELAAGAGELAAGLNGTALPGSRQLAGGAEELSAGLNQLQSQVPALTSGVGQLNAGAQQLSGGANQVADGLSSLNAGLTQLASAVNQLPESVRQQLASNAEYQQLLGALQAIIDGIGTRPAGPVPDPQTLNQAITNLEFGLDNPNCDRTNPVDTKCGFKQVLEILSSQLSSGTVPTQVPNIQTVQAVLGTLQGSGASQSVTYLLSAAMLKCGATTPESQLLSQATGLQVQSCAGVVRSVPNANPQLSTYEPEVAFLVLGGLLTDIGPGAPDDLTALNAISRLIAGIGQPTDFPATEDTLYYGLEGIRFNLTNPNCDKADPQDAQNPCGIKEVLEIVEAGIPQLVDQVVSGIQQQLQAALGQPTAGCDPTATLLCASAALVAGSDQVADGAGELAAGTGQLNSQVGPLANGVDQLADGGNQVADGADQLAAGLVDAGDGSNQVADGARQLADGLGDAADGSVQLSSGLGDAAEAGPQIPQGAQRLSAEGTSQLVEAGEETAMSFGTQVAILEAAAERTADGGLPFGAPDGALKAAAYSYDLAAATGATAQNTGRLLAGVVIAGAAAVGASFLLRRKPA